MYTNEAEVPRPVREPEPLMNEQCNTEGYRPSRQEILREYNVSIRFLTIGCVIDVGCKSIPFSTIEEGMNALNEYVKNPNSSRKYWKEKIKQQQ